MSNTTNTKAAALAHVQAIIAGTMKHSPNGSFTIGNTTYTSASLIQVLQGLVNAMLARNAAETGAKDALTTEQTALTQVGPILRAYQRIVLASFAGASQTLADFGLAPPKTRTPPTAQQLAARTAKAKATRAARGTTSKKQKLAVKGDVTGVIVTPVTASTAATTASPVPPVTAATGTTPASPVPPVTAVTPASPASPVAVATPAPSATQPGTTTSSAPIAGVVATK